MQNPADTLDDIAHTIAKDTVDANEDLIAGLDDVHKGRLHAGASGSGNRDRQAILCPEKAAEHLLNIVHDAQELRVEMPDHRTRERLMNSWMNPGWARPHEQSTPGINGLLGHAAPPSGRME